MGRSIRVTLVRPPVDVLEKFSKPVECLAIGYLAAAVREVGHEAHLVDAMLHDWSVEQTTTKILECDPSLVGITIVLNYFPDTVAALAVGLRQAGYEGVIVIGGHAVSFFPDAILRACRDVDAVVSGEGELPIQQIASRIASGSDWGDVPGVTSRSGSCIAGSPPLRNRDLDSIAVPSRDLNEEIINRDGLVAISTSRGCYARCTFCSVPRFYGLHKGKTLANGSWLCRSVDHVVQEIESVCNRFSVREYLIVDDEFFGGTDAGRARAIELGKRLEALRLPSVFAMSCRAENVDEATLEQLARGGLRHVFIGLETGNDADLKLYAKGQRVAQNERAVRIVKKLGLSFQPGFMFFTYRSTLRQLRENIEFLDAIGEFKPVTLNSAVDPHFGTPLLGLFRRDGALVEEGETSLQFRFLDPKIESASIIARKCAEAFLPFMHLIAGLQSSVTYEWRRSVPGRRPEESALLDAFERAVNQGFTDVFRWSIDALDAVEAKERETVEAEADRRIAQLLERLSLSRALVVQQLMDTEGEIRYWTQRDLIVGAKAESSNC